MRRPATFASNRVPAPADVLFRLIQQVDPPIPDQKKWLVDLDNLSSLLLLVVDVIPVLKRSNRIGLEAFNQR